MAPNFKSRAIATALATIFIKHKVAFVMPMLKNRISFTRELHYCIVAKNFKTTYAANKRHAILNAEYLANAFGWNLGVKKGKMSHLADAIMQVFGYLKFCR